MIKEKIYKDKSLRNATLLFIVYFVFIIFLILLGQNRLIEHEKKESYLESIAISSNIKLALDISKDYIDILSNSKTINAYFSNKALGMSLEYGLKANIIKIEKEIKDFIESKNIKNVKLFSEIYLYEEKNHVSINKNNSLIFDKLAESLKGNFDTPQIFTNEKNEKIELYLVKNIISNNKKLGILVAKLNFKEILDNFIFNPTIKQISYIKINNDFYDINSFYKVKNINFSKVLILTELDKKRVGLIFNYKYKINFLTSNIFIFLLSLLSILIYFIVYKLLRLNSRNELLKEKIYYTEKLNNELTFKVKEKTKELKDFNKKLKQRVLEEVEKNRENESIIYNQSKMAIMGQMLDNIAHQWRQPLSAISSSASSIKLQKELNILDDKSLLTVMSNIMDSTKFLSETIEDFRGFLKENKKKEKFDVKEIYNKTRKLLISVTKNSNIEIIEELESVEIYGFSNELVQVLLNILNNAYDALEELSNKDKKLIFVEIKNKNSYIFIKIKDNAGGIPETIISKIFDAHFSTKLEKSGTGIGLYMTKEIVEGHMKGKIEVSNESFNFNGESYLGAQFILKLPI